MKSKLFISAVCIVFSGLVMADGGIQVGGNISESTKAGDVTGVAIGKDNTVVQKVGGMSGNIKAGGNVSDSTKVGNVTGVAIGEGNHVNQEIGGIHGGQ